MTLLQGDVHMKNKGANLALIISFLSGIVRNIYCFLIDVYIHNMPIYSASHSKELQIKKWELQESEKRYLHLMELFPDTLLIYIEEQIVYINEAGIKLVGASTSVELLGKSVLDFIPLNQKGNMLQQMKKIQAESKVNFEEQKLLNLNGEWIDVETFTTEIMYQGKKAAQVIVRELTERKRTEEKMMFMAHYDSLTGLPNRYFLQNYSKELFIRSSYNQQSYAVMFLDLDRFKMINDTKGHSVGDLVLQEVSKILKRSIENSHIFRYGGDEFVIMLEDIQNQEEVSKVSRRVIAEFSSPMIINGHEIFVTPSIGISIYPTNGEDAETLLKHADTAMYLAKERGKNNYQFYTSNLDENIFRKMEIENELRKALENNEFILYYQPQVEVDTGKIKGIEALIRWNHSKLGMISPLEFISVAEETGLIIPLGVWILRTACSQNKAWQNAGYPQIPVSVNFSIKQFEQSNLIGNIFQILRETGLHPQYLCLEITETIAQHDIERMIIKIQDLKNLGIKIAVDDFGTGYSSLSYLKKFAIDTLKIDQSFVRDITTDINDMAIVSTIISMSDILNFNVIAEGVETKEQLMLLRNKGCREVQGYFYSKPLPALVIEQKFFKELQGFAVKKRELVNSR